MNTPTIAEVREALTLASHLAESVETRTSFIRQASRLDDSMVIVTRDSLATALIDSGLMRRYSEYANTLPTMTGEETPQQLATPWADAILAAIEGDAP